MHFLLPKLSPYRLQFWSGTCLLTSPLCSCHHTITFLTSRKVTTRTFHCVAREHTKYKIHMKNIFSWPLNGLLNFHLLKLLASLGASLVASQLYLLTLSIAFLCASAVHLYLCLVDVTLGWTLSTRSRVDYQNRFAMRILAVFFTTRQVHSSYCDRHYVKQKEIIVFEGKIELVGAEENHRKQWIILISVVRSYYDS